MERHIITVASNFVSPEERGRLVRLCAAITGSLDVAEDLAQETLLEAWRHLHELREREKQAQWLSGIARNVCMRWARKQGHEQAHMLLAETYTEQYTTLEESLVDDYDIEVELERKELIELLDRAMALLPPETRTILVKRYVEESPLGEVAEQLGTNTSVVAMRLQRGKLALRRVLLHEMPQEIACYGVHSDSEWEVTPVWCHLCGQHRLLGRRNPREGELLLRCPACCPEAEDLLSENHGVAALKNVKGYKPLVSRLLAWCDNYYRTGLSNGTMTCDNCGSIIPVHIKPPEDTLRWLGNRDERIVSIVCPFCSAYCRVSLEGLVLALPEGRRFFQAHPRIRTLPKRYIEADGRAAIVTSFESVTDSARLDVVSACDTYDVLRIHGGCK